MNEFFHDLPRYSFLQYALWAAVLSSIAAGIVGSINVVRRSTSIAGAISHCVLGGLGAARYFQIVHHATWFHPLTGALFAAILAACIIAWVTVYARERIDSVLSIVWALGMAIGVSFIMKTPGYSQDLMSYLFGSILLISPPDLALMLILDAVIVSAAVLFYNPILSVCFNEEAARVRGIPIGLVTFIITILTALTIVLLTQIVGIVLVIALLAIPGAAAARFTTRLSTMMIAATAAGFLFMLAGLALSYEPQLPAGATIVEIAVLCYCIVLAAEAVLRRIRIRT